MTASTSAPTCATRARVPKTRCARSGTRYAPTAPARDGLLARFSSPEAESHPRYMNAPSTYYFMARVRDQEHVRRKYIQRTNGLGSRRPPPTALCIGPAAATAVDVYAVHSRVNASSKREIPRTYAINYKCSHRMQHSLRHHHVAMPYGFGGISVGFVVLWDKSRSS